MQAAASLRDRLLAVVRQGGRPEALAWLERGLASLASSGSAGLFFALYAGAKRRFPGPLAMDGELAALGHLSMSNASLAEIVRTLLLVCACEALPEASHPALVHEVFRKGDSEERIALLRALCLLPRPERFLDTALEATRTHVESVFAALACDNPYPARHFPELHFNQLVIKAYFLELPVRRIVDLPSRHNPELARMAADLAEERRAAGRPLPSDLALANPELPNVR